jgi:hypothetical protein
MMAVVAIAIEQPAWGQVRVAEAVKRQGLSISPAGVRCVWQRHDLETMKKRLKALEAKIGTRGAGSTKVRAGRRSNREPRARARYMAASATGPDAL